MINIAFLLFFFFKHNHYVPVPPSDFQIMFHHGYPPQNKLPNLYLWFDLKDAMAAGDIPP